MKRVYTFLFAFLVCGAVTAQSIVFDPNPVDVTGTSDVFSHEAKFKTNNTSAAEVSWLWELDRSDAPAEWKFIICDVNLCYAPGVEMCPPDKPNIMAGGSNTEAPKVTLQPNGVEGTATVFFRTTDLTTGAETGTLQINYDISGPSSIFESSVAEINIYPNPATEYIQIKNAENVSKGAIYNIVGKEVMSFEYRAGTQYNVSDLNAGLYLVRLFDNTGKALQVLRLTKD